ncbi:hypothetical protein TRV_00472 [Trichophyton verrucosum HKI 0517]|uniref:Uncharacterized protein n=1 Tax=Trichophyton verrucosum (strain HKI 0517) TaxID=663202 RepID=D4D078_TRIVH|nr:uncharacterized protein TRV_00472 [Trichophyton verrucosum HKI 0517]EFE44800.1 hypothetical protein TRV_00472 [Trichophyton verrucosum HKI 0517]
MMIEDLLRFVSDRTLLLAGCCIILIIKAFFGIGPNFEMLFDRMQMFWDWVSTIPWKIIEAFQPSDERAREATWAIEISNLARKSHTWMQRQLFLRETIIEYAIQGKLEKTGLSQINGMKSISTSLVAHQRGYLIFLSLEYVKPFAITLPNTFYGKIFIRHARYEMVAVREHVSATLKGSESYKEPSPRGNGPRSMGEGELGGNINNKRKNSSLLLSSFPTYNVCSGLLRFHLPSSQAVTIGSYNISPPVSSSLPLSVTAATAAKDTNLCLDGGYFTIYFVCT